MRVKIREGKGGGGHESDVFIFYQEENDMTSVLFRVFLLTKCVASPFVETYLSSKISEEGVCVLY